jgi:hypothetical protein
MRSATRSRRSRLVTGIAAVALLAASPVAAEPPARAPLPTTDLAPRCALVVAGKLDRRELVVVGVVQQGTQRAVLMMDSSKVGHLVRPGECIGRQRVPFDQLLPAPADDAPRPRRRPHAEPEQLVAGIAAPQRRA